MSKHFTPFDDVDQWDPAPNLTARTLQPFQKRYLAMNSQKIGAIPEMPAADSGSYLVDQVCANTEELQRILSATIEKHGVCYVRITGNPEHPRVVMWKVQP